MKKLIYILVMFCFTTATAQKNYFLLVGTYTSAGSEGVYVYDFNTANGETKLRDVAKISNPSYLAISPNGKNVFAVSEVANEKSKGGKIVSFAFDKATGKLTEINKQPSNGSNPCYVTADKSGKWVITGNYSSGTLAVLPVSASGTLDSAVATIAQQGSSVNTDRQNESHVHATVLSPDEKYLYVPDLGTDKIMVYRFNKKTGSLTPAITPFVMTKPGSGPRHFTFHPNKKYAYLVEELTGGISAYRYDKKNGDLALLQNISTLPPDFMGYPGSADIHVSPDGKFLYASNRGASNTIAIFSIDKKSGGLVAIGHQPVLGKTPRNFNFDPGGNFLLVANQDSNEIVLFNINKQTGLLKDSGKSIQVSKPVCIKWLKGK